jgi:hypothetical protein
MIRERFLTVGDLKRIFRLGAVAAVLVAVSGGLGTFSTVLRHADNLAGNSRVTFNLHAPFSRAEGQFYADAVTKIAKGELPVVDAGISSDGIASIVLDAKVVGRHDAEVRALREFFAEAYRGAVLQMSEELALIDRRTRLVLELIGRLERDDTPAEMVGFLKEEAREMAESRQRVASELAGAVAPNLLAIDKDTKLAKSPILSALIEALLSGACAGFLVGYARLVLRKEEGEPDHSYMSALELHQETQGKR